MVVAAVVAAAADDGRRRGRRRAGAPVAAAEAEPDEEELVAAGAGAGVAVFVGIVCFRRVLLFLLVRAAAAEMELVGSDEEEVLSVGALNGRLPIGRQNSGRSDALMIGGGLREAAAAAAAAAPFAAFVFITFLS